MRRHKVMSMGVVWLAAAGMVGMHLTGCAAEPELRFFTLESVRDVPTRDRLIRVIVVADEKAEGYLREMGYGDPVKEMREYEKVLFERETDGKLELWVMYSRKTFRSDLDMDQRVNHFTVIVDERTLEADVHGGR